MRKSILKTIRTFTAGVIASAVLVLNITPAYAGYYSDSITDHKDVSFSDIRAAKIYDYDKVKAAITALNEAVAQDDNDENVKKYYKEVLDETDRMVTANALLNLDFYTHLDDEQIAAELEQITAEIIELGDMANAAISKMVNGKYRYLVEQDIGDRAKDFEDYEEMSDEDKALLEKEESLENRYQQAAEAVYPNEDERYKDLAEIYVELVKLRKKIAEAAGYTSYREYTYKEVYGRDYSLEAADRYNAQVKKYVTELQFTYGSRLLSDVASYQALWAKDCGDLSSIFAVMDRHLAEVHPELTVSYDYFKKNHLYYMDNDESIFAGGYTTKLYTYNTPFIYNSLTDSFYDYTDVFHEFGHFNQMFHSNVHAMYNEYSFDVAEIHSQTMELFFLKWAEECYGKELAETARTFAIYRVLDSVVSGSFYDEFQTRAFEVPDGELSVDKLTELYITLWAEYGRSGESELRWVDVSHNFSSPFYYISYSTSAMAALQIYEMSKSDYEKAVDTYMKLTALDGSVGFCEAVQDVALKNIMDNGVVRDICLGFEKDNNTGSGSNIGSGNIHGNNGNTSEKNGNTSGDNGNTSGDNGNTSEDNGNTSGDNGNTSEDNGNTSGDNGNAGNSNDKSDQSFSLYYILRYLFLILAVAGIVAILVSRKRQDKSK